MLECELEQMQDEQTQLLIKKEEYENVILPKLINNADEFLILALTTQANYANPNWLADTCHYFERSIKSYATKDNVFRYAFFLDIHNKFVEAVKYYNLFLETFENDLAENEYATTLNNLAILHANQNKYEEALNEFEEALQIRRQLVELNPSTYLPDVAMTLNNLANLHKNQNKYEQALQEYEEALQIRRQLAADNPHVYQIDVAQTCYNLSLFCIDSVPNREKSIGYMIETVSILSPIAEKILYTQPYLLKAMRVLQDWGLDEEEIEQMIKEKMQS